MFKVTLIFLSGWVFFSSSYKNVQAMIALCYKYGTNELDMPFFIIIFLSIIGVLLGIYLMSLGLSEWKKIICDEILKELQAKGILKESPSLQDEDNNRLWWRK
ncbi:MAG: hypothetical protein GX765_00890 [Candidatus Moranbacteria bacterium]|jgi:hypothetical protein|nr:hypothetical protein [Candidatus Moranbacteria bacterium]